MLLNEDTLITHFAADQQLNSVVLLYVSDLVQVVGKSAVETLHGFLIVGAVSVQPIKLQAHRPVEILADRGRTAQRAGGGERDRGARASAAGVHQRTTGKGGLTGHGETPHRHAGGHDGWL